MLIDLLFYYLKCTVIIKLLLLFYVRRPMRVRAHFAVSGANEDVSVRSSFETRRGEYSLRRRIVFLLLIIIVVVP